MLKKFFILKYLPLAMMLITINSHGQTLSLGNTIFWWVIQLVVLFLFLLVKFFFTSQEHNKGLLFINIYLIYVIISFFRGIYEAEGYWDLKFLFSNTMCLLIPILAYATNSLVLFRHILSNYIYYTAPLFLIIQFYIGNDEFGFYLAPFSFLILFIPVIPTKWKILFLLIILYVVLADFGARSNLIKFIVPLLLSFIYFFRNSINKYFLNYLRLFLISLPLIFFSLGVMGYFNIFNPFGDNTVSVIEKKRDFKGNLIEDDLVADTRTFIYLDVLNSAKIYNSWLFGRSPAKGNLTELLNFDNEDVNNRNERNGNEVAILNYFVWLGLFGVLLILIIFYQASYLAVNQSNNIFSKIMGLFIAFRWAYAWVEDINNFHIQHLYVWLFIGFCYSKNFREMSNSQMKNWFLSIFDSPKYLRSFSNTVKS